MTGLYNGVVMSAIKKSFFVLKYSPDGKGIPSFIDKIWTPELPDYDFYNFAPCAKSFLAKYDVKIKATKLDGDYLPEDELVSDSIRILCEELDVKCICIPVDVRLQRNRTPEKKYNLFFLTSYISILDQEHSVFNISIDPETGKLNTPEDRGLHKVFYDSIDLFKVRDDIDENLFFCNEIAAPVCSSAFKDEYENRGLTGITFIKIDDNYKYDAWEGW